MKYICGILLTITMTSYTLPSLFTPTYRSTFDNYVPTYTSLIALHNKLLDQNLISRKRTKETLENRKVIRPESVFNATSIATIVNTVIAAHCFMHCTHDLLSTACLLLPSFIFSYVVWKSYFDAQTSDAQIKKLLTPIEKTIKYSHNYEQINSILQILQSEKNSQSEPVKEYVAILIGQCTSQLQDLSRLT